MTITVPDMRSNKPVSMEIDQLRGWATFMDRAMIVSLAATILAVGALGVTTWLSFRFSGAVRAHELAVVDRYKDAESRSVQLEKEVATARERTVALEQEVSTARGRAAALEQEMSVARERAVALEQDASKARERATAFEQAAREANERSAQMVAREANQRSAPVAARESTATSEKAPAPQLNPAVIQQRLADLAKLVRDATARAVGPSQGKVVEPPRPTQPESTTESVAGSRDGQPSESSSPPSLSPPPPSPIVESLRKYAGTNAAVFVLDRVAEAPPAASTISAYLNDAGWASQTWTWTGVAGILGVVVLIKEGSDAATNDAATALVEALRTAGFNAAKGDWPADWRRYRGALDGPQTSAPTDAPIRIVIGAKAASAPR